MSPRKKAQAAFASALLLLFLSGLATYFATVHLLESERWVIHTHEVKEIIGDIDSALLRAGRGRTGYVVSGNSGAEDFLAQFEAASSEIPRLLQNLRELVQDNPGQRELCSRLETVTESRIALLRDSIRLHRQTPVNDAAGQAELQRQAVPISSSISSIMQQMRYEEQRLQEMREKTSRRLFIVTIVMLTVAFVVALELFAVHYRLLSTELGAREQAERSVRESEESLRRLTGRLLQVQDAERRKFSRELHDSLGQYLAGAKMNLEIFASRHNDSFLREAVQLLDHAMAETRTISHLLHPPLLDEAGLASAARWYVEGFAQRSGIEVEVDLPDNVSALPKPVALALFRVLQETLTNIHRHSGSAKAEVKLQLLPDSVCLQVRDYGKGFAPEVLVGFQTKGTNFGVGLAGMRERLRDLGGQLAIHPSAPGTLIFATIPLSQDMKKPAASAAD
jgi:signal transduction histidine kinase